MKKEAPYEESATKLKQLMSDYEYNTGRVSQYTGISTRKIGRMRSGMKEMTESTYNFINLCLSDNAKRRKYLKSQSICKMLDN